MNKQDLDRKGSRLLNAFNCPKCGAKLHPVIVNGEPVGFDCLDCKEFYSYGNIACS